MKEKTFRSESEISAFIRENGIKANCCIVKVSRDSLGRIYILAYV